MTKKTAAGTTNPPAGFVVALLYTYIMTDDNGSAPNPYHGFMTLALCMNRGRASAYTWWQRALQDNQKMWVAGFAGKELYADMQRAGIKGWDDHHNYDNPYRLIYLMEVNKVARMHKYFFEYNFKIKIPPPGKSPKEKISYSCGDNIYKCECGGAPVCSGRTYKRVPNWHHRAQKRSYEFPECHLEGKHVLIAEKFYYFGSQALSIDLVRRCDIKIERMTSPKSNDRERADELVQEVHANGKDYLWESNSYENSELPLPCFWAMQKQKGVSFTV